MLLPRTRFGSPPPPPPPLTRELVGSHLEDSDEEDEESIDSDGSSIFSSNSDPPLQFVEPLDISTIVQGPHDDFSDVNLWLDRLCHMELSKVQWSPEHNPTIESLSCVTSATGLVDMLIFLDDSTCNTLEAADPIFMHPSGLGMNTEMLESCRAGMGPRPEKRLDIFGSFRRPVPWSIGVEDSAAHVHQGPNELRNAMPTYVDLRQELQEWSKARLAEKVPSCTTLEWDEDAMKRALQAKFENKRSRVFHHKNLMRSRMHAAKVVRNDEELARVLEAKRQFNKKNFEECASEVLSDIKKQHRAAENRMLDELLDLTVLHASQKELLASQYRSLAERIQMCGDDSNTTLQQSIQEGSREMDHTLGNLNFLASESVAKSKRALIRARKITGKDVKPAKRDEVLSKRLSDASGTSAMMSNVYNDNRYVEEAASCIPELCDTLLMSFKNIEEATQAQIDVYSDAYAWLGGRKVIVSHV
jgi:hypothetical protein